MKHSLIIALFLIPNFIFSQDSNLEVILQKNLETSPLHSSGDTNVVFSIDGYSTDANEIFNIAYATAKNKEFTTDTLKKFIDLYIIYKLKVVEGIGLNYPSHANVIAELEEYSKKLRKLNLENNKYENLVQTYREGIIVFNLTKDSIWNKVVNDSVLIETTHKNSSKYKEIPLNKVKGKVIAYIQDSLYIKWIEKIVGKHKIIIYKLGYDALLNPEYINKKLKEFKQRDAETEKQKSVAGVEQKQTRSDIEKSAGGRRESQKKREDQPLFYSERTNNKKETDQNKAVQNDITMMVVSTEKFNESALDIQVAKYGKPITGDTIARLQTLSNLVQSLPNDSGSGIFLMSISKNITINEMSFNKRKDYIYVKDGFINSLELKNVCIYKGNYYQL